MLNRLGWRLASISSTHHEDFRRKFALKTNEQDCRLLHHQFTQILGGPYGKSSLLVVGDILGLRGQCCNRQRLSDLSRSKALLFSQMLAIDSRSSLSARIRARSKQSERQEVVSEGCQHTSNDEHLQPNRKRILLFTSKFYISLLLTLFIVICTSQIVLFHYYVSVSTNSIKTRNYSFEDWHCLYPGLGDIFELAQKFGLDLVVIDPDLVRSLENEETNIGGTQNESTKTKQLPTFTQPLKRGQESTYKTIVHLTAINETSGGQPSLKLFYNALKSNGFSTMKFVDTSQLMQPEVYHRASHLFDDMPLEGVWEHKYSHDTNSQHESTDSTPETHSDSHENEISKIYTEFITHIFILNRTQSLDLSSTKQLCNNQARFTVIHIFVLYNYNYNPSEQWIQPGLVMDEVDKHKLLRFNVHSFDFRIPIEQYYIHQKSETISLVSSTGFGKDYRKRSLKRIRILRCGNGGLLRYANNTYTHCEKSQFNIRGLIDNSGRISNYLSDLDSIKPIGNREDHRLLVAQLTTAFHFMDTFSKTYGNFSFWITGATLLAYHKHCDLAVEFASNRQIEGTANKQTDNIYNLEIGLFSDEMNATMLEDLAKANNIGIVMLSDWRKSNTMIRFRFKECPKVVFSFYLYELRKNYFQQYFITRNSMITSNKSNRRSKLKRRSTNEPDAGHHVFNTNDLNLCWTCIEHFKPFRVPCNVNEHLRRIFIV